MLIWSSVHSKLKNSRRSSQSSAFDRMLAYRIRGVHQRFLSHNLRKSTMLGLDIRCTPMFYFHCDYKSKIMGNIGRAFGAFAFIALVNMIRLGQLREGVIDEEKKSGRNIRRI